MDTTLRRDDGFTTLSASQSAGSAETRSKLFTVYNGARQLARCGKLELSRVNKALGLAQQREQQRTAYYSTSLDPASCTCPDFIYRCRPAGTRCKHLIALAFLAVSR
jgi:hypothetical protein